jgi:hypothetical protein
MPPIARALMEIATRDIPPLKAFAERLVASRRIDAAQFQAADPVPLMGSP